METENEILSKEHGSRSPESRLVQAVITALCIAWSAMQLYIAYQPVNSTLARAWHLGFAILLAFLCYPAFSGSSKKIPLYDWALGVTAASMSLFIWWDYENIVMRQGLATTQDVVFGVILIVLLIEAARRALGPALSILAGLFLSYTFLGPYLPELLRHRGIPLDFVINDMYLSTTGIFGIPLGVSTSFVFLFVLFGALLDQAGAGKYFIDVAFSCLGRFRGGPAKASIVASGMTGMVSGSSIANTVTTGTFTIPLMKKVGLPDYKAAAVEVAASTNGQLMPPVMGAAAFIMAEIIGIPYLDVVRAALIPAVVSYLALFWVVHLEAKKLNLKPLSTVPAFVKTFLDGIHFLLPVITLVFYLVVLRRSAITSVLLAIEATMVIILLQAPIRLFLSKTEKKKDYFQSLKNGAQQIWQGLQTGARNMIPVGIATATAGIIVGVVTSTGLVGRFVSIIDVISMGNLYLMLLMTALCCMILGMGLPTTANYIVMATLTAPVIVELGTNQGFVFPIIAAHLFVFYYGILADDTPPVGLAAYAAAAIAQSDPIKTGIQGFTYDLRTAILPFIFLFNQDLLMIAGVSEGGQILWQNNLLQIAWVIVVALLAMFAFATALQGFFDRPLNAIERLLLLFVSLMLFLSNKLSALVAIPEVMVQFSGLVLLLGLFFFHKRMKPV